MSVRAKYKIDDKQIDAMDLTITLTMSVADWRSLMREQNHTWPACDVGRAIATALGEITKATERHYFDPRQPPLLD